MALRWALKIGTVIWWDCLSKACLEYLFGRYVFYVEEFLGDTDRVNNIFNEIHTKLSRTKSIAFHQIQI